MKKPKTIKVNSGDLVQLVSNELNPTTFTLYEVGFLLNLSPTQVRTLTVNGGLETIRNGTTKVLATSLRTYLNINPIKKK